MLFRDIPESQFLTKNSRFVYSEDDEHLKYIRHMNLRRNMPKYLSNKYGIDEPINGKGGSISYEKLNYDYEHNVIGSYIDTAPIGSDSDWVMEYKRNGKNRYVPLAGENPIYPLSNNKVSFKIYWNGGYTGKNYDDLYYTYVTTEHHYSYVENWLQTYYETYDYNRYAVVSNIPGYVAYIRLSQAEGFDPGGGLHYFFPTQSKTYELRFKVRLHNIEVINSFEYYTKTEWYEDTEHTHSLPHREDVKKLDAAFVPGVSVNFDNGGGPSISRVHINSGPNMGQYKSGIYYYDGLYEHYDWKKPAWAGGEGERNDMHWSYGGGYGTFPCDITKPYIWDPKDTPFPSSYAGPYWCNTWKDIPTWQLLRIKDALSMETEDIYYDYHDKGDTTAEKMAESYFVRFGNDGDWHEYVVTYYPEDYKPLQGFVEYPENPVPYLTPALNLYLSGLRPTTTYDSYIEFKDLTIKSKPYTSTSYEYNDIDHFYLNKEGVWLPDNFEKSSDNKINAIRTEGTKIGTGTINGFSVDIFSPPVVTNASVTSMYQSGTKIATLNIDGVDYDIYYPIQTIHGGYVYLPVSWSSTPLSFNIYNNKTLTLLSVAPSGLMLDNNGVMFAHLDNLDLNYSFGLVDLNAERSYNMSFGRNRQGTWLCEVVLDISTSSAYIPDDSTEYIKLQITGARTGIYYNSSGNTYIEKRIPMDIFKNGPLTHYKIRKSFIYYNSSSSSMNLSATVKGKLKSGASLVTSENLTLKFKARKVTFS